MKKSIKGTYRLRSLFGKWWIIKKPDTGDERRAGPYTYDDANNRCHALKNKGWSDVDRAT